MRYAAILLALVVTSAAIASEFKIQLAFPSDSAGNAITPNLGEPFWMTVQYSVTSSQSGALKVGTAWTALQSPNYLSQTGNRQATYGPLYPLMAGKFNAYAEVGDSGRFSVEIDPAKPTSAIEYFAPRSWQGSFGAGLQFKTGTSSTVTWFVPNTPTLGFQTILANRTSNGKNVADGVIQTPNDLQASSNVNTQAKSVRVNAAALRLTKFISLKNIPSDVKKYLKAETLIESNDKLVKNFVTGTLPKGFDKSMSVYDAAQYLFQATVGRLTYTTPKSALPSAVQALKTGYGDCGYFASLFTAAARQAGIPARPVTGFLQGSNQWHVWAEFYVPGSGWVPVDPAYADGIDPQGTMPVYFGVIPEMNARLATSVGFDHSFSKYKLPILQSPYAITDVKKVASSSTWSQLAELP